jgi:hypothetical protein
VGTLIVMEDRTATANPWRAIAVRDRRYSIRYPFAADAEIRDVETGAITTGVTSDISLGGAFVCSSKSFQLRTRIRITLTRKEQIIEALGVIRVLKPHIGMGIEFLDVESPFDQTLFRWLEHLRRR